MQDAIDQDLLPSEKGPARASAVEAAQSPQKFIFAAHMAADAPLLADALQASLSSLLRARARGPAPGLPMFGEAELLLLHDPSVDAREYLGDVIDLPWAEVGATVTLRRMDGSSSGGGGGGSTSLLPEVHHALGRIRAMQVAVDVAQRRGRHLVWIAPGVIFGCDPASELWNYSLQMTVLAGAQPGQYSAAMLLVPPTAVNAARSLLTMTRNAMVRGRSSLAAEAAAGTPPAMGCDALLDGYLSRELTTKSVPHQVLRRTRFRLSATVKDVLLADVPAGRACAGDMLGKPKPLLDEFLALVEAIDGVGH